jgi:hypothetical protein
MRLAPVAVVAFTITTAFTAYLVFYTQTLPAVQTRSMEVFTYTQKGSYDYVATLRPNLLYNTTLLRKGEGTLFTPITRTINVTFTYELEVDKPAAMDFRETYTVMLSSEAWNRTMHQSQTKTITKEGQELVLTRSFQFNITEVMNLIRRIEEEIGYRAPRYKIEIRPVIEGNLTALGEKAAVRFLPFLNLTITPDIRGEGGRITIEGTDYGQRGVANKMVTSQDDVTIRNRQISYVALASSLTALSASLWFTKRPAKRSPEQELQRVTQPYREVIARTNTPPKGQRVIAMESWEDLVKVADTLGKPVLYFINRAEAGEEHLFYVLDGPTCYIYRTKL